MSAQVVQSDSSYTSISSINDISQHKRPKGLATSWAIGLSLLFLLIGLASGYLLSDLLWGGKSETVVTEDMLPTTLFPENPYFDIARLDWNQAFQPIPQVIAICTTTQQVQQAVLEYAIQQNMSVNVRSGRHNYAGLSIGEGLIIDVSPIDHITLNMAMETAVIGSGAMMYDIYQAFAEEDLLFPGGTCPDVAGGLYLGGGQGMYTRMLGLASDTVLAMDIVLPDGTYVQATWDNEYRDLLYALTGAGAGDYGVVVQTTFNTSTYKHALYSAEKDIAYFEYEFDFTDENGEQYIADARTLYQAWVHFVAEEMPLEMTTRFNMLTQSKIHMDGLLLGSKTALQGYIDSVVNSVSSGFVTSWTVESSSLQNTSLWFNGCSSHAACANMMNSVPLPGPDSICLKQGSLYGLEKPSVDMVNASMSWLDKTPDGMGFVYLLGVYGGNFAKKTQADGPFYAREAVLWMEIESFWTCGNATEEAAQVQWERDTYEALLPYLSNVAYRNHPDLDLGDDWMTSYFHNDTVIQTLVQTKAKYDPFNRFRNPQSTPLTLNN
jgi:hypothetical protein